MKITDDFRYEWKPSIMCIPQNQHFMVTKDKWDTYEGREECMQYGKKQKQC